MAYHRNAVAARQDRVIGRPSSLFRWAACPATFWPPRVSPSLTADTRGHHDRHIDRYADRNVPSRPAARGHLSWGRTSWEPPADLPHRFCRVETAPGVPRGRSRGGKTSPGAGTSSGAIGGKSADCVDMPADDGTGGAAYPCPGGP